MGQLNIFAFCFQVRGLVFLQKITMNDESNVLPCPKRAFSDVLEGVVLKSFLGASPQGSLKVLGTLYMIRASLLITYIWKVLSL